MSLVEIRVKLGEEESILEVPEGTPVGALPDRLEPRWRGNVMVIVNGRVAREEDLLDSSDRVSILPLMAGG